MKLSGSYQQINYQSGFTLIEVLASVVIFSVALLGLAEIQILALRGIQHSYWQSIAALQLVSAAEQLRANHGITINAEFVEWNGLNARLLPQGSGQQTCQLHTCDVAIEWREASKLKRLSLDLIL